MRRFKPQNKKSRSRLKKAAAVFALAAVSFLAGYVNWKCDKPKPKPASVETIQRSWEKAEDAIPFKESKTGNGLYRGSGRTQAEIHKEANAMVMKLSEEFPYESLDCSLLPLESRSLPDDYQKLQLYEMGEMQWDEPNLPKGALRNTSFDPSISKRMENMCNEKGFKLLEEPLCRTRLIDEIKNLKESNNIGGLLMAISYLNSLNLEWVEQGAPAYSNLSGPETGYRNTRYINHLVLYLQAHSSSWNYSPSFSCVARNAQAIRLFRSAMEALGDTLLKNPQYAEYALGHLPEHQYTDLLEDLSAKLFSESSEGFDRGAVEKLFAILSPASRTRLLETLENMWVTDDNVSQAEELAKYASDPELRIAMERVAARWKWKVKSIDEKIGEELEEENSTQENEPGEE